MAYPMKKNTAKRIVFPIYSATGDLLTAATGLDSEYSLDGASWADCTNEATEIGTSGWYYLDLIAGETNGDVVCIQIKTTAAGAKTTPLAFYTNVGSIDEVPTIDNIWAKALDGAYTAEDILKVLAAVLGGKTTITITAPGEATIVFRDLSDTVDKVTATVEGSERTSVTIV